MIVAVDDTVALVDIVEQRGVLEELPVLNGNVRTDIFRVVSLRWVNTPNAGTLVGDGGDVAIESVDEFAVQLTKLIA